MRNTENLPRGRQTFGITTPLPPVREKELAPPPTPEEVKAANLGELAGSTRTVEKVGKNRVLKAVLGGGVVVAGGAIAYEAVPAVHRAVDSAFLDHLRGKSLSSEVSVFDNRAKETKIGKNNIHFVVGPEQISQLKFEPVINKEEQTIRFLIPFEMPENTTGTIERIDLAKLNPNAPENLPPIVPIDLKFNNIVSIIAPENAHVYLVRGVEELGQNPNFAGSVRIYKYYPKEDTTVLWWISDNHPTKKGYLVPLLPMQDFDKQVGRGTNYEKLPTVDALTKVATTSEPNQPIHLNVMAYRGKVVGPEAEIANQDFLLEPKFQTTATGQLAVIAFRK